MLRTEYVDVDFNLKLQKDLQEDEVVCSHCGGTGLQVDDNPFGLSSENSRIIFPHKIQTIVSCIHCYNGVQKKCLHCDQILDRSSYQCNCEKAREERKQKQYEKDLEIWNKAKKISYEQALNDYVMVYIENYDRYVMVEDLKDWIIYKEFDIEKSIELDKLWIYGTSEMELQIDASDIIENACSELHEDAMYNISDKDKKELQEILDRWCEKNKWGTTSYYPDYEIGIQLKKGDLY